MDDAYEAALVVGSGPSLIEHDVSAVADKILGGARILVIAVNDAYRMTREITDLIYACDYAWWMYHCQMHDRTGAAAIKAICPDALRYTGEPMACREFGCRLVHLRAGRGIAPPGSGFVMRGYGSGFQAVGLAVMLGAKRIALLGMDCKRAEDGRSHFFGEHPKELPNPQPFEIWAEDFNSLAGPARELGIEIVNCTRDTAITALS